jgi:tight adherence protein B
MTMPATATPRAPIVPRPEFAKVLRQHETFASLADDSVSNRLNGAFDLLLIQSGLEMPAGTFLLLCLLSAMTVGGAAFVVREHPVFTALGLVLGGAIPVVWAALARSRRQQQLLVQLPEAVDALARAARTGRSLEQCLAFVGQETAAPLGEELQLCSGRLSLGLGMSSALEPLPLRTGLVSLHILSMALSVHAATGGDLVHVLDRLSKTLRERALYLGRLRAQTAASRATITLMMVLPPLIVAFFAYRDPEYFSKLLDSSWSRAATFTAVILDVVGIFWALRILKMSRRS